MVLQLLFLAVSTVAFGLALQARPFRILYNVVYECGVSYLLVGGGIATGMWHLVNRLLMAPATGAHEVRREAEWQYCLDIHCNAYFAYFALTHVAHFVLLPIVLGHSFIARFLANAVFAAGAVAYLYVTFRGYLELPALQQQVVLLYPAFAVAGLFVLATLFTSFNMSHAVLHHTWPIYD
jgi:hypothetical protein